MKPNGWKQALASRQALICLLLACATIAVYWSVTSFGFVNYDDDAFVYQNDFVCKGLTPSGMWWALTTSYIDFWHPITWWSHMADVEFFGLNPAGHHLINLVLHIGNVLLLFLLFQRMTGRWKRSAVIAAIFALHPTHIESVAWIAERKDVLSTLFFFLSLLAYVRYVDAHSGKIRLGGPHPGSELPKSEGPGGTTSRSILFYVLSLGAFALGLMTKAMLVTLPFVLLLLDVWPLNRIAFNALQWGKLRPLLMEKLPFFALTVASCAVTWVGMKSGGNLLSADQAPWSLRLANVPVSYLRYIAKFIWPVNLTVLYPMPRHWPTWHVVAAIVLLAAITLCVIFKMRRMPYLAVGWFLFLGTLVPVIGIVANGLQSIADRYLYIPSLGLIVAGVWAVAELAPRLKLPPVWLNATAIALLLLLGAISYHQLGFWRDSFALWTRCLALTRDNPAAEYNMGVVLQKRGQTNEALIHFTAAQVLKPDYFDMNNLGVAYAMAGRLNEATNYFEWSLRLKPDYAKNHEDLGSALLQLGDFAGAIAHSKEAARLGTNQLRPLLCMSRAAAAAGKTNEAVQFYSQVLQIDSSQIEARAYLGQECLRRGQMEEGVQKFREIVNLQPGSAEARFQYAVALTATGDTEDAIKQYHEAVRLAPEAAAVLNNLAWILATHPEARFRNGVEATELAQKACELSNYKEPIFLGTLAAAYAETGKFDKAQETARKACDLASANNQADLLAKNKELLKLYASGKAYREGKSE